FLNNDSVCRASVLSTNFQQAEPGGACRAARLYLASALKRAREHLRFPGCVAIPARQPPPDSAARSRAIARENTSGVPSAETTDSFFSSPLRVRRRPAPPTNPS